MAVQEESLLHEPLDMAQEPKLQATTLKPSLSEASMNLIIDYRRTLLGELTKSMFWDLRTISLLVAGISVYVYMKLYESLQYQTMALLLENRDFYVQLFYVLIAVIMIITITFTFFGELSKFLKLDLDKIAEEPEKTFKFDLIQFAQLADSEEGLKLKELSDYRSKVAEGDNTQLIIYRGRPVALITIAKDDELSREDQYVVRINGLGVRRVYADTGLQKDLIQWSYLQARDLYLKEGNLKKDKPLRIFIEVYSFEKQLLKTLKELPGWQKVSSEPLPDFIAGKLFGHELQTWGIGMNVTSKA